MSATAAARDAIAALYRRGDLIGAWNQAAQALQQAPGDAALLSLLGLVAMRLGRLEVAAQCFEQVLRQQDDMGAAANLGNCLHRLGRYDGAVAAYGRALAAAPAEAVLHGNLGGILIDMGRIEDGIAACRRAVALAPETGGPALKNIAIALHQQQRFRDAVAPLTQALRLDPLDADAHNTLGLSFHNIGRAADAERRYRAALALMPGGEDAWNNLAALLYQNNLPNRASLAYGRLLAINPGNVLGNNNLGVAYNKLGRASAAILALRRALCLRPEAGDIWMNLGNALKEAARLEEAGRAYDRGRVIDGDPAGILLLLLNSLPEVTPQQAYDAHLAWAARHADPLTPAALPRPAPLAGRRLRVGYVSPDLWTHSVSYFFRPLLEAHDRARVEVFVYSDCRAPDDTTAALQRAAEHWRATTGLSDAELCEQIRRDGVDVLIDMAGHTADNRLRCFARRPAPVQASWLGYPNTTGLRAMDWRITDVIADPPGDSLARERLLHLPGGFLCYRAPDGLPEPGPPPLAAGAPPVFGSFNNSAKLAAPVIALWARLLRAVPGARLLLKSRALSDPGVAADLGARFAAHGADPSCLELLSFKGSTAEHLAVYDRVDIGLDPFPYNGTTTTCEALWMGVPVVTLLGRGHAGRVGASLLAGLGLGELIARDGDSYVRIAAGLAADAARLGGLRAGLRQRMRQAPLCDAPQFARRFEAALYDMAASAALYRE